jgi:multidrug transporter EmrE-like cation transporter
MTLELGILLALACAFATNLGFLYKHRGACAAPAVDVRHPFATARALFSSRWFAIGMLVALGAWALHVAALAMAPMSLVQSVLAGGVVLLAVMAERLFGYEVGPRQRIGVTLTAIGLVLLGVTLPASTGAHSHFSLAGMIAFEGGLVGIGALLIMGPRMGGPVEHHGVMLGAGVMGLVSPWLATAIVASVAAFYASARGLQDGDAVPVIAITATAANVSGIAGGIIVFGDPLPADPVGVIVQVAAFAMVCLAAALTPAPVRAARATA